MTENEIKALGRRRELERLFAGKKVWLKNHQGLYMGKQDVLGATWSMDEASAQTFDFDEARVADQMFNIQMEFGHEWEVEEAQMPYSVMLLYPDYIADMYGQDTFMVVVRANDPKQAVELARTAAANLRDVKPESLEDLFLLLVCEGAICNLAYRGEVYADRAY